MLWKIKSKLWEEGSRLFEASHSLGVRNNANYTVYDKAVGQFGENNVEAHWNLEWVASEEFQVNAGLIWGFGIHSDVITIYIHWSDVTITNEEDRSTKIKDLFCKLVFDSGNYKSMHFSRTTFSQEEWDAKYSHSHLRTLNETNPVRWTRMCLGSGPINETIRIMYEGNYQEETLDVFFWELDKVVHVESLRGVPYIRMAAIGTNTNERADVSFNAIRTNKGLKNFMQSFFGSVKIPLGFENGTYVSGCTFMDFALLVTNYWNKYVIVHPKAVYNSGIQKYEYILKNSAIFKSNQRQHDYSWKRVDKARNSVRFKGEVYALTVTQEAENNMNIVKLVDLSMVKHIQRVYLTLVNMKFSKSNYGKEEERNSKKRDQDLYALRTSNGICSINSKYGAEIKDTLFVL